MSQFFNFVINDVKKSSVEFNNLADLLIDLMSSTFKIRVFRSKKQKN